MNATENTSIHSVPFRFADEESDLEDEVIDIHNMDHSSDSNKTSESTGPENGSASDFGTDCLEQNTDEIDGKTAQDLNTYAAKKTVAQGMMDIALITANANQLRFIIEFNRNSPTFYFVFSLIIVSLLLQIGIGISLIFKGRLDMKGKSKHADAKRINKFVVGGIFLVTIINVFIASFTMTGEQ